MYKAGVLRQKRLRAKVVSIGNITWGGTGKTPLTIWLASRLEEAGVIVSILTRGYGRASAERVKILPAGTPPAQARNDGDEVQLYLRHLRNVPIGISASRYEAGRRLEEQGAPAAHLLDDGFPHLALARDLDLVLIDATNPWGNHGRAAKLMRESLNALRRADAILLTRCELVDALPTERAGLEQLQTTLHRANPAAPQFQVRTRLLHFVNHLSKAACSVADMRRQRVVAFCGLGNPGNFFSLLETEEIRPVARKVFCDHHRYATEEIRSLETLARENEADCFLTTEKDLVNLPQDARFSLPVYWTAIEPVVQEEGRLLQLIRQRLGLSAESVSSQARLTDTTRKQEVSATL
jgi:tetraacyldisaccharide 4'-kinase